MFSKSRGVILLFIILATLVITMWYSKEWIPVNSTNNLVEGIHMGFWTAFFGLIFLGLSAIIDRIVKRESSHYNSLVNLEVQLNEMFTLLKDNIETMSRFKEIIVRGNIFWGSLSSFPLDKSHFNTLYDKELINQLFTLYYKLRRLNEDMMGLQEGYADLRNGYIQKTIKVEQYVRNSTYTAEHIELLIGFSEQLAVDVTKLFTRVRIQIRKDKPYIAWLQERLIYTSGKNVTLNEFEEELLKLLTEIEDSSRRSKSELAKLKRKK